MGKKINKNLKKKSFPLFKVYQLIESGPVVLLSTSINNSSNIMTMSWHMMMDFEPPLIGCIVSNRNYSFEIIKKTKECVINIPSADLANKVVACGNSTGKKINKFEAYHFTPVQAQQVKAPLIKECFANLECRVVDAKMATKYNLFIVEVVQAWITPSKKPPKTLHHLGWGEFMTSGKIIKLKSQKK